MDLTIREATIDDLDELVPLFDVYRQFYRQPSDLAMARDFLSERIKRQQSIIFMAFSSDSRGLGFTQLYPSFSSASAARIYILNDLFVTPAARGKGIGARLLRQAEEFGRAAGAVRLRLSTEISNVKAQTLYELLGWKRDTTFCEYNLGLAS
ncbi:MAG: GNAT family N-acetyltransferase [Candidatus Acidiferrales bacterium]